MQFKLASLFVVASVAAGALAGQNCKCQASNGQGPQYNTATDYCCHGRGGSVEFGTVATCVPPFAGFMGPNNQCSAGGTNCIDSGAFVRCCQAQGAPSAFCWN